MCDSFISSLIRELLNRISKQKVIFLNCQATEEVAMKRMNYLIIVFLIIVVGASSGRAAIPQMINYQGLLMDDQGDPLDGSFNLLFAIYTASSGGTELWSSGSQVVSVSEGLFSYQLGSSVSIPLAVFSESNLRYLAISVEGEEIDPRTQLLAAPYSYVSSASDHSSTSDLAYSITCDGCVTDIELADNSVNNDVLAPNAVTSAEISNGTIQLNDIGQNGALPDQVIKWNGSAWSVEDDETGSGDGDWTINGNDIYSGVSGNVGVGITTPSEKLDVLGNFHASGTIQSGNSIIIDGAMHTISSTSGSLSFDDDNIATTGKATIGPGNSNVGNNAFVAGGSNTATGNSTVVLGAVNEASDLYATVSGGYSNVASGGSSAIAGGYDNSAEDSYAVVGGGRENSATGSYSVIGGGGSSSASGGNSTIGGGYSNSATHQASTVAGGQSNEATATGAIVAGGRNCKARGAYSVVGGGGGFSASDSNSASGSYSTLSGGIGNLSSADYSTIGGGDYNVSSLAHSTVAGGRLNQASGLSSSVGGGGANEASGEYAVIAGGGGATIGSGNTASGDNSGVLGGRRNTASGDYSIVAGGDDNTATNSYSATLGGKENESSGQYSVIPGGIKCRALGRLSMATGSNSKANHDGSVVIAANNNASVGDSIASGGLEQIILRADGGLYITNILGTAPYDPSNLITTRGGAYLSGNGTTWTNASDKNLKENYREVDAQELLDRLSQLQINRWNYRSESDDITHIGPVAQDFHALFGVGGDDKSISTIDPAGIALAAIQALNERTKELEEKSLEVEKLSQQVEHLTMLVSDLLEK